MFYRISLVGVFLGLILIFFVAHGCSILGLTMGIAIDHSRPDSTVIMNNQVAAINPGTLLYVYLKNNDRLVGKFVRIERVPLEIYIKQYANNQKMLEDHVYLPSLGDTINLQLQATSSRGYLLSFDEGFVDFKPNEVTNSIIISLEDIVRISDDYGNSIEGDTIRKLVSTGQIPIRPMIVIQNESGNTPIPMYEISIINKKIRNNGILVGFIIGLVVDVISLAILNSRFQEMDYGL